SGIAVGTALGKAVLEMQSSLVRVTERAHPIAQAFERRPRLIGENADAPNPVALLRTRRERPGRRRAAEQRDELATCHSITSAARASSLSGTSRPSALAVLRLNTSSNLVVCMTGRSAGFSPLRMRPA